VQALRLGFDVEAWQVRSSTFSEAAFQVLLEADTGEGFQPVADLGTVTTGPLERSSTGRLVDGNDSAYRTSFDSGPVAVDVPVGATLRMRWKGTEAARSRSVTFGLDNVSLRFAAPGDADIDGLANFSDFVLLADHYGLAGDWGDGDFDNNGLVEFADFTILADHFGQSAPAAASVPEPATAALLQTSLLALWLIRRSNCRIGARYKPEAPAR
jgi:hypothetical protein